MDVTGFTDTELGELGESVLAEQERRGRLARVPERVAEMTAQYVADGGDKADIVDALA